MSDKKDSDDDKVEAEGPKPATPGEADRDPAAEPDVAGAEDGLDPQAPGASRREAAEALSETDPAAPAAEDYDPNRPDQDAAPDAAPLGEDPAAAREAEAEAAEQTREDELAAGLEERGSDRDPDPETEGRDDPFAPAAARPGYDDDSHDLHDEHEGDEHGRPGLAARALQGLVLLLVGAGLAIWAAPKIAPYAPAPVSRVLSPPQAVTPQDLEALRADFDARLGERSDALSARIDEGAQAPDLEAALAPLRERLSALESEVESGGGGAAPERVTSLQNEVEDLRAQMDSLRGNLSSLGEAGEDLPPEVAQRLGRFNAAVESLRAEVDSVSSRTEELAARLQRAEARFEEEVASAQSATEAAQAEAEAAERRAALTDGFRDLSAALDEGRPFAEPLEAMAEHAEPPEALSAAAESGVPTLSALRERFTAAGRRAMQAQSRSEAGEGALDQALAAIRGSLAGVPVDEVEGEGLEAALGRAAARLRAGDLAAALAALQGLPDPAREAMSDWLSDARARLDAVQAAQAWRDELLGGA